jgi:hypothetical protein
MRALAVIGLLLGACFELQPLAYSKCGNGVVEAGEACEPSVAIGDGACVLRTDGVFAGGAAQCTAGCERDQSSCAEAGDASLVAFIHDGDGRDLSRSGLQFSGTVASGEGQSGTGLALLGAGLSAELAGAGLATMQPPITIELWLQPQQGTLVFDLGGGIALTALDLGDASFSLRADYHLAPGHTITVAPEGVRLTRGKWVFVAVAIGTDEKAAITLYVFGQSAGTESTSIALLTPPTLASPLSSLTLSGNIDELRIWNVRRNFAAICADAGGSLKDSHCALAD